MIEKMIRALKDTDLKTHFGFHSLVEGEVKRVRFKNQRVFDELIRLGSFAEADRGERESKNIPVILPEVTEDTIVGVEPLDKTPDAIDQNKPDLSDMEETQNPTVEELETILKQKGGSIEVLPNGEIQAKEPSIEELTPEQETEGLSEVEEIPVEKQDESKPVVLKLSDVIDKP